MSPCSRSLGARNLKGGFSGFAKRYVPEHERDPPFPQKKKMETKFHTPFYFHNALCVPLGK